MTQLSDSKLAALETLTGSTGTVQDLEAEYLVLLGATASRTIVDQWGEVFDNAAIAAGHHNDRWMAYMDSILAPATEDQYNEREREYWDNGGTPLGPVVPTPPFPTVATLVHWWDKSDPTQVFVDTAGTIPAVDNLIFRRVNNKGTDTTPITDAGSVPIWRANNQGAGFAGGDQPGLSAAGLDRSPMPIPSPPAGNGICIAAVLRRSIAGIGLTSPYRWTGGGGAVIIQQDSTTTMNWRVMLNGATFINTTKPVVQNEWLYVYGQTDAAGAYRLRAAGAPEQTGVGIIYGQVVVGGSVSLMAIRGQGEEFQIYDGPLSVAELAAMVSYFDGRYGTLPHL